MPAFCSVIGCSMRGNRDQVRFFRFPAELKRLHRKDLNELSKHRRQCWIKAVDRGEFSEKYLKNARVCSRHFISGEPAQLEDEDHPDWIPSQNLGYVEMDEKSMEKSKKALARAKCEESMKPPNGRFWTNDFIIEFLNMYKKLPCLWKFGSAGYMNQYLKNTAYEILTELCKKTYTRATRDDVMRIIRSLRSTFRKEHKKVMESKRNGHRPEDVYVPSIWYYNMLLFTVDDNEPIENFVEVEVWDSEETLDAFENVEDGEYQMEEEFLQEEKNLQNFGEAMRENTEDYPMIKEFPQVYGTIGSQEQDVKIEYQDVKIEYQDVEIESQDVKIESGIELKKRKSPDQIDEITEYSDKRMERREYIEEHEASAISWSKKLGRMEPTQAVYAELLVNKILSMGLLNQLEKATDVITEHRDFSTCDNELSFKETPKGKPSIYLYHIQPQLNKS